MRDRGREGEIEGEGETQRGRFEPSLPPLESVKQEVYQVLKSFKNLPFFGSEKNSQREKEREKEEEDRERKLV